MVLGRVGEPKNVCWPETEIEFLRATTDEFENVLALKRPPHA